MKMSIADRLLLTVYTLIIVLVSIAILGLFVAIGINAVPLADVDAFLQSIELNWQFFLIGTLVSLFFLVVSIKLLFAGRKSKAPSSSLLKHTELGVIRISVETLETMGQKAVRGFEEVKDVRINTITEDDGVRIQLKVSIMPDVILPDLSVSLQKEVKEYIESHSGIVVKEVLVYVDNLTGPPVPQKRPRVQ